MSNNGLIQEFAVYFKERKNYWLLPTILLLSLVLLSSGVSAFSTYQTFQNSPDYISASQTQMLIYVNFTKPDDVFAGTWNLRYNVFNASPNDETVYIVTENILIPDDCWEADVNHVSFAYTYRLIPYYWQREFYCFNGTEYKVIEINTSSFNAGIYGLGGMGAFDPSSLVVAGYSNTNAYAWRYTGYWDSLYEARGASVFGAIGMLGTGVTWNALNTTIPTYETIGAMGYGISAFLGGLTSSLSGLIVILAIVGAIVLILGGVVFMVLYAINYVRMR